MNRNFNIAEILKSVDVIVTDNKFKNYGENKITNGYKIFTSNNIDMSDNPKTEKIIIDAEKSLKNKDLEHNNEKIEEKPLILNTLASSNLNLSEPLVLKKEFIVEEKDSEDSYLTESIIEKENNLKELENNYIYKNKVLKSENVKQQEVIKDLNILLYDFKKQKRYTDLDNKIKLYQEDNTILRKKIFDLSRLESDLRLHVSELSSKKQIEANKTKTFEEDAEVEKEEIKKLNIQIKNLSQKNNQLQSELFSIKKDKEYQSTDISQKIKFYREEYAKIIIDKSDIQKKFEITKTQLLVNEQNKTKLKLALENLNQILSSSNIETRAFGDIKEEFSNKSREEK